MDISLEIQEEKEAPYLAESVSLVTIAGTQQQDYILCQGAFDFVSYYKYPKLGQWINGAVEALGKDAKVNSACLYLTGS